MTLVLESLGSKFSALEIKDNVLTLLIDTDELLSFLEQKGISIKDWIKLEYDTWRIERLHGTDDYKPQNMDSIHKEIQNIKIKILLESTTSLQKITSELQGKPFMSDATIMYVDEPKSYITFGNIICSNCSHTLIVEPNSDYILDYDKRCKSCEKGEMELDKDSLKFNMMQYIFLEEFGDQAKNNSPVKFTARVTNELVGDVFIGQRKRFVGLPKTLIEDEKDLQHKFIVDIISFHNIDEEKPPVIDIEEIMKIQDKSEKDDLYLAWLTDSFAPHIKNRYVEKLAILLSIISGTQGMDVKSRSHTLLVGDAGSGKSELGKFAKKIITKGDIVDGTAVSQAGLVFGLDKMANGQQIPTAGAVVLNNGGVVIIDEFDKVGKSERKSLHMPLEQGIAIYNKIKKAKAPAVITCVALANPKYLEWKENMTTMDNLEHIESTLLDRFDTTIRVKPFKDVEHSVEALDSFIQNINKELFNPDLLGVEQYKGFIHYIKKIEPKFDPQAHQKILDYYRTMLKIEQPDGSKPMSGRQGEGLIRLCISMARLYFKDQVDCRIVDKVIEFFKETLQTLGMKTEDGVHQTNMETYHMNREETFWEAVRMVEKNDDGYFNPADLYKILLETPHFKYEDDIEKWIDIMHDKRGKLQKHLGKYRKI